MLTGMGGCKKPLPSQLGSLSPSSPIRIGEVGSMTGADATFGISTHQGISLALAEVNATGGVKGHPVELVSVDDRGVSNEAVLGMNRLIHEDHVMAVLGEVASSLSLAMAPVAQQYQIPMISPSSIHSKLTEQGNFIFRVCYVDSFQSKVMADFAFQNLRARQVAILEDVKSDYSRDSAKLFAEFFTKMGGKVILRQSYSAGDIDFKAQLTAIRTVHPDLILVPGYYTDVGLIALQRKELGLQAPLLGGDGWDSPKLREIGGTSLEGSYFVSHFSSLVQSDTVQKFIRNYRAQFGGNSPDGLAALGYDTGLLVADALKRARSLTSNDLREALATTREFSGVTGKISIGPDRNAIKPAVVFQFTQGGSLKLAASISP